MFLDPTPFLLGDDALGLVAGGGLFFFDDDVDDEDATDGESGGARFGKPPSPIPRSDIDGSMTNLVDTFFASDATFFISRCCFMPSLFWLSSTLVVAKVLSPSISAVLLLLLLPPTAAEPAAVAT